MMFALEIIGGSKLENTVQHDILETACGSANSPVGAVL
jgi:hypothetical protein